MADPSYIVDGVLTDPEAWVALEKDVLTGTTTSVRWDSADDGSSLDWSQFMDLVIICYTRTDGTSGSFLKLNINGTTGDWFFQATSGDGATASAVKSTASDARIGMNADATTGAPANAFGATICWMSDVNSGKYKSVYAQSSCDLNTTDADESHVRLTVATCITQAPISRIDIGMLYGTNFQIGSRFDLFGVLPRMVS